MRRYLYLTLAVAATLILPNSSFASDRASAGVTVSANLLPHVRWSVRETPEQLVVTAEDVARGYVEVEADRLRIQTNDPAGYLVRFTLTGNEVARADVSGLDGSVIVSPAGGFSHQPFRGVNTSETVLMCRLALAEATRPGAYQWPLQVTVHEMGVRRFAK